MRVRASCGGVQMFKDMRLIIRFDMFLNPSFKMMTSFANIAKTTASTNKFTQQERFEIIRNWVIIWKNNFYFRMK